MGFVMASAQPDCASNYKGANRLDQARRKLFDLEVFLMRQRKVLAVVVDMANRLLASVQKNSVRPDIVRWWIKTYDEVPRKQVRAKHFIIGIWIDENVCERCRGVTDIAATIEHS